MKEDHGEVRYEVREGIATITLSRPDKRNSLTRTMFGQLSEAVASLEEDAGVRAAVIMGEEGEGFCAGDDLTELVDIKNGKIREFLAKVQRTFLRLETLPIPVIAAVKGHALGGGLELAMSCDIIFASEGTVLGLPETGLGIIPGA
jgi:methylglutaconyl-CoA hydratase